jgi:hypothetical protein
MTLLEILRRETMIKVSYYKNIFDVEGVVVDLDTVLSSIKKGKFKEVVTKHRNGEIDGKKVAQYFTVGGVFSPTRSNNNCSVASGLVSIDLDNIGGKGDIFVGEVLRGRLYGSEIGGSIYACFDSLGGNGLCLLIKTPPTLDNDTFKKRYYAIYDVVEDAVGDLCKVDDLSDIARPRFISDDYSIYINKKAYTFDKLKDIEIHKPTVNTEAPINIEGYLPEHEEILEVVKRYEESSGGFGERGTRHDWVLGLARWMCRGGISEPVAINHILTNFNNSDRERSVWEKEVARCVRSSYRTYGAEQGTYRTPKKFDPSQINTATNVEDAKYYLLLMIEEKKKLANYLVDNKKNSSFVESDINFLTKLYKLI